MSNIREKRTLVYVNDLAMREVKIRVAIFEFTLDELYALESWVPLHDTFHTETTQAIRELEEANAKEVGDEYGNIRTSQDTDKGRA